MNDEKALGKDTPTGTNEVSLAAAERLFPVVAIGASAGGIDALRSFFGGVKAGDGVAYIVATHLSPERRSNLAEVLARFSPLPVVQITDGMPIAAERVYVLPPNKVLCVERLRLRLRPPEGARPDHPIDSLFESLATEVGAQAVAVVLSGYGSDGSRGLKAIRAHGGFAMAQGTDSTRPQHADMPHAAIRTGLIDAIVPVQDMPARIVDHARHAERLDRSGVGVVRSRNGEIDALCELLQRRTDHDFRSYKKRTFVRRAQRRMQVLGIETLADYVARCRAEDAEVDRLLDDLLIGVTQFFRDPAAFEALLDEVIPHLFEGKGAGDQVRVWVPGCSTGEEAYSVAILLRAHAAGMAGPPRLQIFATDIDERAIKIARIGHYGHEIARDVPPEQLQRYFQADDTGYRIAPEVREMCIFSTHSLIKNPPYSRLDLISCRNLMIYFDSGLQARLGPLFHFALRENGYLFLGASENVTRYDNLFTTRSRKHRIYQRKPTQPMVRLPMPSRQLELDAIPVFRPNVRRIDDGTLTPVERTVLYHYGPPFALVDRRLNVVHLSTRTGRFLQPPADAGDRALDALIRFELRPAVRQLVQQSLASGMPEVRGGLELKYDDVRHRIDLAAHPLSHDGGEAGSVIVMFNDHGPIVESTGAPDADAELATARLEAELRVTREILQTTVEEQEAAAEELRATNEELLSINEETQSSNEELETAKEEFQSLNEELQSANQEIQARSDELDRVNLDLKNLIDSTEIATLFLDLDLRVRTFTPSIRRIFRLIPGDAGRAITDIANHLDAVDLEADMLAVAAGGEPVEREVHLADGRLDYILRIFHFRDRREQPIGIVLTFVDVTRIKAAERQRGLLVEELNHRVKNILAVVSSIASHMLRDHRSLDTFGPAFQGRLRALAQANQLLAGRDWAGARLSDMMTMELQPHLDGKPGSVSIEGTPVTLVPRAALTLGLALHELATNAAKYGALAHADMRLEVVWRMERRGDATELVIEWRESGAGNLAPPEREGFGSSLIKRALTYDLNGQVDMDYRPDGLTCTITLSDGVMVAAS